MSIDADTNKSLTAKGYFRSGAPYHQAQTYNEAARRYLLQAPKRSISKSTAFHFVTILQKGQIFVSQQASLLRSSI
jgi:hypothetical protein